MGLSPEQAVLTEHMQKRKKQLLHWGIAHALKNLFQFLTSRNVVHLAKRIYIKKKNHIYTNIENVSCQSQSAKGACTQTSDNLHSTQELSSHSKICLFCLYSTENEA